MGEHASPAVLLCESMKLRAAGHRKIADGHKLLGRSIEIGNLHTKQSADNHHKAHMMVAEGHEMIARAEEALVEAMIENAVRTL